MPPLYGLVRATAGTALRLGWRPRVSGLEHLPAGGAILAGNHLSVADQLLLGAVVPRHIAFWAKAEYLLRLGETGQSRRSVSASSTPSK